LALACMRRSDQLRRNSREYALPGKQKMTFIVNF